MQKIEIYENYNLKLDGQGIIHKVTTIMCNNILSYGYFYLVKIMIGKVIELRLRCRNIISQKQS